MSHEGPPITESTPPPLDVEVGEPVERTEAEHAAAIAQGFIGHCFDQETGAPTENAANLLQTFREVEFAFIGEADVEARQSQTYPPGVKVDGHIYGECCLVAGDYMYQEGSELLIVRRDPAVGDVNSADYWLVLCYPLEDVGYDDLPEAEGADRFRLPVRQVRRSGDWGKTIALEVKREPDHEQQSCSNNWLVFTLDQDEHAQDGAVLVLPDYYSRGPRQVRSYSVDFSVLRPAIVSELEKYILRPEDLLRQKDPVTTEQLEELLLPEAADVGLAA